jgi:hypothetical protein
MYVPLASEYVATLLVVVLMHVGGALVGLGDVLLGTDDNGV